MSQWIPSPAPCLHSPHSVLEVEEAFESARVTVTIYTVTQEGELVLNSEKCALGQEEQSLVLREKCFWGRGGGKLAERRERQA